jgi:hypothetical protein
MRLYQLSPAFFLIPFPLAPSRNLASSIQPALNSPNRYLPVSSLRLYPPPRGDARCYGYVSRDKYPPEDVQSMDAELMDVPTDGIHIIFDHQVSSDDEDPDVVHFKSRGEKPQNGSRAG